MVWVGGCQLSSVLGGDLRRALASGASRSRIAIPCTIRMHFSPPKNVAIRTSCWSGLDQTTPEERSGEDDDDEVGDEEHEEPEEEKEREEAEKEEDTDVEVEEVQGPRKVGGIFFRENDLQYLLLSEHFLAASACVWRCDPGHARVSGCNSRRLPTRPVACSICWHGYRGHSATNGAKFQHRIHPVAGFRWSLVPPTRDFENSDSRVREQFTLAECALDTCWRQDPLATSCCASAVVGVATINTPSNKIRGIIVVSLCVLCQGKGKRKLRNGGKTRRCRSSRDPAAEKDRWDD